MNLFVSFVPEVIRLIQILLRLQSFHEQGFPATQVFERAGPIADPMYHQSGMCSAQLNECFANNPSAQ